MRARTIVVLAILALAQLAFADPTDLPGLKAAYDRASDPLARRRIVARIGNQETDAAAGALEKIAQMDPDPGVRVAAINAMSGMPQKGVRERLLNLLADGGVRAVRQAVAEGLARRGDGAEAVTALIAHQKADDLARALAVEALGRFRDPVSLHRLMTLAVGEHPFLRSEALRSLAGRPDGSAQLALLLEDILERRNDIDTVLTALLVIRAHPDESLRAAVKARLKGPPLFRKTAGHVLTSLDYSIAKQEYDRKLELKRQAEAEGYGMKVDDPPPPPKKPGWKSDDLVFVIDATGSTSVYIPYVLESIRRQFERTTSGGGDLRVGIVTYRGAKWQTRGEEVLPLTHDLERVREFLTSIKARGADSQGSAASYGLKHGLARMNWRADTEQTVNVVTDSRTHHPDRCRRLASLFYRADGVTLNVRYFRGRRVRVPADLAVLAEAGGGRYEER